MVVAETLFRLDQHNRLVVVRRAQNDVATR